MRRMLIMLCGVLWMAAPASAQTAPCEAAEHRSFDFWVGEWHVHSAQGKLAGSNDITREYGGCVLHERYRTAGGYRGESLNNYDARRKIWHQTWVDNTGLLLLLEGGLVEGSMVLQGQVAGPQGAVTQHRIRWTPRDDGRVRQHWESHNGDGAWRTLFDGLYSRR